MSSLNSDGELWIAEKARETCGEVLGPLCCWWVDCWGW